MRKPIYGEFITEVFNSGAKRVPIDKLLEITQPEVSSLLNGRDTMFSLERLLGFLNKLDRKVTVQVSQ